MIKLEERIKDAAALVGGVPKLADLTGIPRRTLYSYANGRSEPTSNQIAKIISATGISLAWLVLGEGDKFAKAADTQETSISAQQADGPHPYVIDGLQRLITVEVRSERQIDPELIRRLTNLVDDVYRQVGHKTPIGNVGFEVATLYNDLAGRVSDLLNTEELDAHLLALRLSLKSRLEQAAPGSGKASAS